MKDSHKAILITLVLGIAALALSKVIWPIPSSMPHPTDSQLPFFIFLSLVESLLFGLGVAFIVFAWPLVASKGRDDKLAFIALAWMLVSWWPHDNLHQMVGMDFGGLLYIEYGFHLTLIIASLILANYCYTAWKGRK